MLRPAGAGQRIDFSAAEIRAEIGVTAGEIGDLDFLIHRMRRPGEEDHRLLVPARPFHLRQHGLFAGFDELPALQAEIIGVDDLLNILVGRRARLDAVNLAFELIGMFGEIGKVFHALFRHIGRHRQRELGALKVLRHHLGRFRRVQIVDEGLLGRHPVAKKDIDFAIFHGLITDRHRQRLDVGFITQRIEHDGSDAVGGGNVGPAGIAKANGFAGSVIGRLQRGGECRHGQNETGGDAMQMRNGFHCGSPFISPVY
ncbi:hypothetical protein D3C86_1392000 [compost metagenome]